MPSHRGLTCNLQMKKSCRSGCNNPSEQNVELVPAKNTFTDDENNIVATCVAVKPGWFDVVLEVNEFISEYLVLDIFVDGRHRGTKVNDRRMRTDNDLQTLKSSFQPLGGVQSVSRNDKGFAWVGRRWRFDDIGSASLHSDTSPDDPRLATIVVRVRRCIRVMGIHLDKKWLAKEQRHYGRRKLSDKCLENAGITNRVTFGPEETYSTDLESSRRADMVTDTLRPTAKYTFTDSEIAPFAIFGFYYGSLDVSLPSRLDTIRASLPVGLRPPTRPTLTNPPPADQQISVKPPSIVWQVAPSDTQDSSDPDVSLSKLQAQLEVLRKKIEHQKRRKVARERRKRKELLKSRLVEMEAQIRLVKTELMELSGDGHEAEGGD